MYIYHVFYILYTLLIIIGLPIYRPNDYFCENIKTDAHMSKIKDKLLIEEKRIESFELRKNKENNRKFNKQLIEIKKQEKQNTTKNNIKVINLYIHINIVYILIYLYNVCIIYFYILYYL